MPNYDYFISSILGSVIAIIPTFLYVKVAFVNGVINYPENALKQHKRAMKLRFLLTLILFALVFVYFRHCNFLLLFIDYIVTLSAYWINLIRINKQ